MAGAVLENFDYQVDVTVWIALKHVVESTVDELIVEPDSEEDVAVEKTVDLEPSADGADDGQIKSGARLITANWQVQVKRRNKPWRPLELANASLLKNGDNGRDRALAWLKSNPEGRYAFVTDAQLADGIHGLRTSEIFGQRVGTAALVWTGAAARDPDLANAAIASRIGVRDLLSADLVKMLIERELWKLGVPVSSSEECVRDLRNAVWDRLNGTKPNRHWTRQQMRKVLQFHGGLRGPNPEFVEPKCYEAAIAKLEAGKCVVIGESGFGKSSLLRALVLHHRRQNPAFEILDAADGLTPLRIGEALDAPGRRTLFVFDDAWGAQARNDRNAWRHSKEFHRLLRHASPDNRFLLTTRPDVAPHDFRPFPSSRQVPTHAVILDEAVYPIEIRREIVRTLGGNVLLTKDEIERLVREKVRPIDIPPVISALEGGMALSDALSANFTVATATVVKDWVDSGNEDECNRAAAAFWLTVARMGRWTDRSSAWLQARVANEADKAAVDEFVRYLARGDHGEWRDDRFEIHVQRVAGIGSVLAEVAFRRVATQIVLDDFADLADDVLATLATNAMTLPGPIRIWLDGETRKFFEVGDLLSLAPTADTALARAGRWYGHFDVGRSLERMVGWIGRDIDARPSGSSWLQIGFGWGRDFKLPDWHHEIEDDVPQIHALALAFVQRFAADQPGGLDADVVEWLARISPPVRQYLSTRLPEALGSPRHERGLAMYTGGAIASGEPPTTLLVNLLNALDDRLDDLPRIRRESDADSSLRNADDYFQAMAGDATVEVEAALKVVVREIVHQGDQATIFQHARVADLLEPLASVIDLEDEAAMRLFLASAARSRPAALDRMMQRLAYTASRRPACTVGSAVAMLEPPERIVLMARIRHQAAPGKVNPLKDASSAGELEAALALNANSDAQFSAEVGELLRAVALVAAPTVAARAAGLAWVGHALPQHILDRLVEDEDALATVLECAQVPDELARTSLSHTRADVRAAAVGAAAKSETIEAAEWEGLFEDPANVVRAACLEAAAKTRLFAVSVARLVEDEYVDDSCPESDGWSSPIARRAVEVLNTLDVSGEAQLVLSSALEAETIRDVVVVDGIEALLGRK